METSFCCAADTKGQRDFTTETQRARRAHRERPADQETFPVPPAIANRSAFLCEPLCLSRNFFSPLNLEADLGRWYELHSEVSGLALERCELALLSSALEFGVAAIDPGLACGEQPIEEAREHARHGFDGFNPSQFGPQVAKAGAQVTLTA